MFPPRALLSSFPGLDTTPSFPALFYVIAGPDPAALKPFS